MVLLASNAGEVGTVIEPVPVTGLASKFSPMLRSRTRP
jgi:hypothetical protein